MSDKNAMRPIIGVGVLVWREKQLLLGKRLADSKDVCWQFPGGHLENNESVID
ncbi:MAG: NUDIX domain-containing protein, partial [Proteobacteria bacterium]|nr:NUDIX domain-containing protein [Pseudomonadota bacterium]